MPMASFNSKTLFLALLVAISALTEAPSSVEAQFPSIIINGSVPCPAASAAGSCFDASMQLRLGTTTVATTTSSSAAAAAAAASFRFVITDPPLISSFFESLIFNIPSNRYNRFFRVIAITTPDLRNLEAAINRQLISNGLAVINNNVITILPEAFEYVDDTI